MVNKRRRGTELETAIYQATLEALEKEGFLKLNFGHVSELAGTSKSVLYRRWDTPFELAVAAIKYKIKTENSGQMDEIVWQGHSLKEDLEQLLNRFIVSIRTFDVYSTGGIMIESSQQQQDVLKKVLDEGIEIDIRAIEQILQRAQARGEIKYVNLKEEIKLLPFDWIRYQILIRGSLEQKDVQIIIEDVLLPTYLSALN
ncbi:TetR/AcrR family transcriptional regulator [Leuconostoc citreum]|jgi:AcrR family transcriptional regulator|uniref:Transcriptional regulator n=2 Tax=Leuconostoc citreum TaxID=33964 RepID=B1MYQ5_LEUCK|nr:TetR/AcrR family transcriptional regulator C-terminal ligand-binding domain-containing protein [Leuconostoc citreum]ACA82657.1 Transcriptional regulator [Leuconostoc citreum KM20]MCJ2167566.1 TetR/AcrR family transcriptional regulator C-terminal ligand-binding domain-containing protein [Leuconostoc citreum]MCP1275680.1 TetR/AcrR family transcriptional regulator C-terminal ligand-binding domain-containing protein [Leuconostoc citreum]MCS8595190.1 TetR/AcrR family transcriptional regulator [Le